MVPGVDNDFKHLRNNYHRIHYQVQAKLLFFCIIRCNTNYKLYSHSHRTVKNVYCQNTIPYFINFGTTSMTFRAKPPYKFGLQILYIDKISLAKLHRSRPSLLVICCVRNVFIILKYTCSQAKTLHINTCKFHTILSGEAFQKG